MPLCRVNRSSKSTFTYSCFQTVDGQCFCLWWSKMRFRVRTIRNFNYSPGIYKPHSYFYKELATDWVALVALWNVSCVFLAQLCSLWNAGASEPLSASLALSFLLANSSTFACITPSFPLQDDLKCLFIRKYIEHGIQREGECGLGYSCCYLPVTSKIPGITLKYFWNQDILFRL